MSLKLPRNWDFSTFKSDPSRIGKTDRQTAERPAALRSLSTPLPAPSLYLLLLLLLAVDSEQMEV